MSTDSFETGEPRLALEKATDGHSTCSFQSKSRARIYRRLQVGAEATLLHGGSEIVSGPILKSRLPPAANKIWKLERARHEAAEILHLRSLAAGEALKAAFLPPAVAEALRDDLTLAAKVDSLLVLGLDIDPTWQKYPWEALCLSAGEPLALHPQVALYRVAAEPSDSPEGEGPGPLRILVAIGSPEKQNDDGSLLDMEAELSRILDACEPARQQTRGAYVHILENGSVEAIRRSLETTHFHVLHLSCHALPGILILEKEDGDVDFVTAPRLSRALPSEKAPYLVVLAGCSTAMASKTRGEKTLPGLALSLLENGVPAVAAMRAAVSDSYATAFTSELYRSLTQDDEPEILRAFSAARRKVELARLAGANVGQAEWSTPILFLRSQKVSQRRLFDPTIDPEVVQKPTPHCLAPSLPVRRIGDFVGRRADLRRIMRALIGEPAFGGVLIRGLGGSGKSTLSAQIAHRLSTEGWLVVPIFGPTDPESILDSMGLRLLEHIRESKLEEKHPIHRIARHIRRRDVDPIERLAVLSEQALEPVRVVLLLDNFEDNLEFIDQGAQFFKNATLAIFLGAVLQRATVTRTRLLITSRYSLPLDESVRPCLLDHTLGPLSPAETRKLIWRLPGLDRLSDEEKERVRLQVGGHPRVLEYLDALISGGVARFSSIDESLKKTLRLRQVDDAAAWFRNRTGNIDLDLAAVVTLAADEVFLDLLLEHVRKSPLSERLLVGAAVYRVRVEERALIWQTVESRSLPPAEGSAKLPDVQAPSEYRSARDLLTHLGLLASSRDSADRDLWLVHRWTATQLLHLIPEEMLKAANRQAARYWRWCFAERKDQTYRIDELQEARFHHYQAGELEEALLLTEWICTQLHTWGEFRRQEHLIREALQWVPENSEKAAIFYHELGILDQKRANFDEAVAWYHRSLGIELERGNQAGIAATYHQLGTVAEDRGDHDLALEWYHRAIQIFKEIDNSVGLASAYHQLGSLAEERSDFVQSSEWFQKSLSIKESLGRKAGMAATYHHLGRVAQKQGEYEIALDWLKRSLDLSQHLGDLAGIASSCQQLGWLEYQRRNYDQALDWQRKSIPLFESQGNQLGMANAFNQLGLIAQQHSDYSQAVEWHQEALAISEEISDRGSLARSLYQLGRIAESLGSYEEATDRFRTALAIHEELGNQEEIANSLLGLGEVCLKTEDYDQALTFLREAHAIFEKLGSRSGTANSCRALGNVAFLSDDPQRALAWFEKSLAINKELGDRLGLATSYQSLGIMAQEAGDYRQALGLFHQALTTFQELGNRAGEAAALSQIGDLLADQGQVEEGIHWNLESLAIRSELQVPEIRRNLYRLTQQMEAVGEKRSIEILTERLDDESLAAVISMLIDYTQNELSPGDHDGNAETPIDT